MRKGDRSLCSSPGDPAVPRRKDRAPAGRLHGRYQVLQWVCWQIGGLGPSRAGASLLKYAPERSVPNAPLSGEVAPLHGDGRQPESTTSRARTRCQAWLGISLRLARAGPQRFPERERWFETVGARPAVKKGANVGQEWISSAQQMTDEDRKRLFNLRDEDLKRK